MGRYVTLLRQCGRESGAEERVKLEQRLGGRGGVCEADTCGGGESRPGRGSGQHTRPKPTGKEALVGSPEWTRAGEKEVRSDSS